MRTRTKHGQFPVVHRVVNLEVLEKVVSRLGLEPRALALKGLIRLLRPNMTESDEERQSSGQD